MKNLYKNIAYVMIALSLTACAHKPKQVEGVMTYRYYLHGFETDWRGILSYRRANPDAMCQQNGIANLDGSLAYEETRCW